MKTKSFEPRKQLTEYSGFVSYSHIDKKWARRLHRALEKYRLPKEVASTHGLNRKLGRFFRDDDELAGSSDLSDAIKTALARSKSLIVICSPNAAQSRWVDTEITQFQKLCPDNPILGVIVEGKPHSDNDSNCFPPALMSENTDTLTSEPMAPDVRSEPFQRTVVRIVAGLLDLNFDILWQRELRRRRQRQLLMMGSAAIIALGVFFSWSAYLDLQSAKSNAETRDYAARAQQLFEKGELVESAKLALMALPKEHLTTGLTIQPDAEAVIRRLATLPTPPNMFGDLKRGISMVRKIDSKNLAVSLDDGSITVVDIKNNALHVELNSEFPLNLLPNGQAAYSTFYKTIKKADGNFYETMTTSFHSLDNQQIIRGFTGEIADWVVSPNAQISMDGNQILAKNTASISNEAPLQLAILALPIAKENNLPATPQPKTIIDATFAGYGEGFKASFLEENSLAFSWGKFKKDRGIWRGLALWHHGTEKPMILISPSTPPACDGERTDKTSDDLVTISKDRTLVSHSVLLSDKSRCVQVFQTSDGKVLSQHKAVSRYVSGDFIDAVRPLNKNELLITTKFGPPQIWIAKRHENILLDRCEKTGFTDFFSLEAISNIVSFNETLVCSGKGGIYRYNKIDGSYEHLPIPETTVTALSATDIPGEVAFGTSDGNVGLWSRNDHFIAEINSNSFKLSSWNDQVALLEAITKDSSTDYIAKLFTADGQQVGVSRKIRIDTPPDNISQLGKLLINLEPLNGDHLLWTESWHCGLFNECPKGTSRRLNLIDSHTGETIFDINNLLPGEYPTPIKLVFDETRNWFAAAKWDGGLELIDLANGGSRQTISLDGMLISDFMFSENSLWVIASLRDAAPLERESILFRINHQGNVKTFASHQAQNGWISNIHPGNQILIAFNRFGIGDNLPLFYVAEADKISPSFKLGKDSFNLRSLPPVVAKYQNDRIILVSDQDRLLSFSPPSKPVNMPASQGLELAKLELIPTLWGSDILTSFSVDPLGQHLFTYSDNKLYRHPLTDKKSECKSLPDTANGSPIFSPNSQFLLFDTWRDPIIHQYSNCHPTLDLPDGTGRVLFVDDRHIWIWGDANRIRIIEIPENLNNMRDKVVLFANAINGE